MAQLLLGLDVGTTYCKALVLDSEGEELSEARARTPWASVPTGAELDPHTITRTVHEVAASALAERPRRGRGGGRGRRHGRDRRAARPAR